MACGCEKDKAKKECNDFTKAVINIENPEVLTLFHKVVIPASMGDETTVPPAVGKYCNTLVYYEASEHSYLYSSDGIPTFITGKDGKDGKDGIDGRDGTDGRDGAIQYTAGTGIDISAQNVISATGSATVAWGDITGDLSNQTDLNNALGAKQDALTAGANITIDGNNEISATDTTYSNFVGTDGVSAGVAGLVPGPATTDAGTYLKADGTWATPPGTTYTAGTNIQINGTTISATDTTYTHFTGTDGQTDGTQGLVPGPLTTDYNKFLSADGTWQTTPDTTYTAGANITIDANNEISATDTTYFNFTGTDGVSAGAAGLVPGPTTSDTDKYLKSDGTWATVSGGGGSNITMTSSDPGEGSPLAADNFLAYYTTTAAREVKTSTTNSIDLEAGKWVVIHSINVNQINATSSAIYIYNLGNADANNKTWAVPAGSGQNVYNLLTRIAVPTFTATTTCTLTAGTVTNANAAGQMWVAIPID